MELGINERTFSVVGGARRGEVRVVWRGFFSPYIS